MDEVERAVDRIYDPQPIGERAAGLFTEHRVAGEAARERVADMPLDRVIGCADPVLPLALGLGGESELTREIAARERTGVPRELAGERGAGCEGFAHVAALPGGIDTTPWFASATPTTAPTASGCSTAIDIANNSPIGVSIVYSMRPPR